RIRPANTRPPESKRSRWFGRRRGAGSRQTAPERNGEFFYPKLFAPYSGVGYGRDQATLNGRSSEDDRNVPGRGLRFHHRAHVEQRGARRTRDGEHPADRAEQRRQLGRLGLRADHGGGPHGRHDRVDHRRGPLGKQVVGEALLSRPGHGFRPMQVVIIDGYVDEASNFGVPPYLSPYTRYVDGAVRAAGHD